MLKELMTRTRTVRRFAASRRLTRKQLVDLVDLARLAGSARNAQVLKFMPIIDADRCAKLFPLLAWAGYLPHWPGPAEGERPPAYLLCLQDNSLHSGPEDEVCVDLGIATQNILLGAAEQGVYGCRIKAFSPKIHTLLDLEERYRVLLVLALGYPQETVVMEAVAEDGSIRYWHDDAGVHHVPKRSLEELLLPEPEQD
ncbi:MAG: nitroreductase [Desulfobulbus propionicus]|nr:MAG: nitroreductase [Desulfobulbus propionicus]